MLKVMTIVGTRPELIRLSRVVARLDETVEHVLVHTGQNYDYVLNEVFFADLGIRRPDHLLGVDTSSLGRVLGDTLIKAEEVLLTERPDAVLVLGDTNSCIAAVMAKRMKIPVYHMEAGNRCFDENVPEETNRRLIDHVADFNLVYTEHARRNLLAEGLHPRRILLTGSPMREVLDHYRPQIDASNVLDRLGLTSGGYFLVSAHREENVDLPSRLDQLLDCLVAVRDAFGLPLLVSTHPRTRKRLEARRDGVQFAGITFHEPFGFHDYNKLQLSAACVLSDSGTIAEEATILGFPAITLRDSIERPEALDTGGIVMTGLHPGDLVQAVLVARDGGTYGPLFTEIPQEYKVDNTAERVIRFILSTCRRHRSWAGIRSETDARPPADLRAFSRRRSAAVPSPDLRA
jgi:UDP-N-acetylglucosamine 2-epimerase